MARRSARRTYVRDGRGRFASTGTTTAKAKPAARRAQRGTNRITRDNSGRITGVGKNGATARGGRLRTAAGNQRGAVLDRMKRRQPPAGTMRASDAAMARVANSSSKRIERRNKSGENPPWAGRENSGSRLRRAKARIADQKARQGGAQPPMRPVSAGKLSRAKARAKAVEGRGQRIQQAILSTQDSPVAAGMRYAAARAAGTPIPKRELNRLTKDMRSYQKALRSTMTAQRAMAFYGKSKPKPAAPKQAKAARPSGTIRKPRELKPGAIAARKAKAPSPVKPAKPAAARPAKPAKQPKATATKPAPKGRRIDAAKVERILARVQSESGRPFSLDRKGTTKLRNFNATRTRAMAYLAKAAGGKNVKTSGRKVKADYGNATTREQLLQKAADKLNNPTRRSTSKSGSKVVAERQAARKRVAADAAKARRGEGSAYMYGRRPSGNAQTLRALPRAKTPEQTYSGQLANYTPKQAPQRYAFEKISRSRRGSMGSTIASDRKTFLTPTTVEFSGRTVFRSRAQAARAQAIRKVAVGKLAGTARLGGPTSGIRRGKASQRTLTGGRSTTYGRARFANAGTVRVPSKARMRATAPTKAVVINPNNKSTGKAAAMNGPLSRRELGPRSMKGVNLRALNMPGFMKGRSAKGTVRRPANYVRKATTTTKAATAARRPAKTRQDKAAQAMRLASRAAARSQSPKLSKAAALRSEKLSASLRARAKQLSQRPTLSRAQRDTAARARSKYGVKSTGTKGKKGAAGPGGSGSRTRKQAASAQRQRREQVLGQTRSWNRSNPRIRAVDTGMRQLALVGKPKKLKRYKPVK